MAEYGKVFDLLDDACLNIQDVEGNVRPFPQMLPYQSYHDNIIVYKIDVDLNHFFGRLQDYTDTVARKEQKEIWTFAVQWEASDSEAQEEEVDLHGAPKGPMKRRKVGEAAQESRPKPQPAPLSLMPVSYSANAQPVSPGVGPWQNPQGSQAGNAPISPFPQSQFSSGPAFRGTQQAAQFQLGPVQVPAPLRSPSQFMPSQSSPSMTGQLGSPTAGSMGPTLSPLAASFGQVQLSSPGNPMHLAGASQSGQPSTGFPSPNLYSSAQLQAPQFQQGSAPGALIQAPQFQVAPASPHQVSQFQSGQAPHFQQGPGFGFTPTYAPRPPQPSPQSATRLSPTAPPFVPGGVFAGTTNTPVNPQFSPATPTMNVPGALMPNPDIHPQPAKDERKLRIDRTLLANEDILRILGDIAQCADELIPNFIDILYKMIDYYTRTSGMALKYADWGEIPSLDRFEVPPEATRMAKLPVKPNLAALELKYAECERLLYTRPRQFGIEISEPEIDPEARINPLVNMPTDPYKRAMFLAACAEAREKAIALLLEAGMTIVQISNYQAGQELHPMLCPGDKMGHGLSRLEVNMPYANTKRLYDENEKRVAVCRTEEVMKQQIEKEMVALGIDPGRDIDKYMKPNQQTLNISDKIKPLPGFIYFPRCCSQNGTDAVLLVHIKHSGEIVISRAVFFTIPFEDFMTTLIRAQAVKAVESYGAPHHKRDPHGSHQKVYSKLLEAHALMTTHQNREEDLTKRWRTGRLPFYPSALGYKPPEVVASWGRCSVWEGWGLMIRRPILLTAEERRGAAILGRDRLFADEGIRIDVGLGWEVECREEISIWERERRRREAEALADEEEEAETGWVLGW